MRIPFANLFGVLAVSKAPDCPTCRLVRFYLLLAVPLLALVGMGSLGSDSSQDLSLWFARVELIDFLAWGSVVACLTVVGFRVYFEIWLPKKRRRALDKLRSDNGTNDKS